MGVRVGLLGDQQPVTRDAEIRGEFVGTCDRLFTMFQTGFENYAFHSERMRTEFIKRRRRIPLLHRDGNAYLISPASERLRRVSPEDLRSLVRIVCELPPAARCCVDAGKFADMFVHGDVREGFAHDPIVDRPRSQADAVPGIG